MMECFILSFEFIIQIAPRNLRGAFGTLHQLVVVIGILLSQVGMEHQCLLLGGMFVQEKKPVAFHGK